MGKPFLMGWAGADGQNINRTRHHPGIAAESFRCGVRATVVDGGGCLSSGEVKALNFLRQQGFKYLKGVKGGITAWSEEIDSNVPRY